MKSFKLNCYWNADNNGRVVGKQENTWEGQILVNDDNSCYGYAIDAGKPRPTHLLVGTIVEGKGISLCKIHANNPSYDPIIFDAFKNENGKDNVMYGCFYARTPLQDAQLGISSIEVGAQPENAEISKKYKEFETKINNFGGFHAYILNFMKDTNYNQELVNGITEVYAMTKYHDIPVELLTQNQPGSN